MTERVSSDIGISETDVRSNSIRSAGSMISPQNRRGRNAYAAILEAIRGGDYRPGDFLREEEIARRLGVSRTPVREALARLQENGLVNTGHGRSLSVASLSIQQLFELYATRGEFEGIVARFAARQATDVEIDELRRINTIFRSAPDPATASQCNRKFHAQLYDSGRNRYLKSAVEHLHASIALLQNTTFVVDGRIAAAADEHDKILTAIEMRDCDAACKLAAEHIFKALKTRLSLINTPEHSTAALEISDAGPSID